MSLTAQLLIYCGEMHEELGDDAKALECYRAVIALDENFSQGWYLTGCVLERSGDATAAASHFRRAIGCDPPWPRLELALFSVLV